MRIFLLKVFLFLATLFPKAQDTADVNVNVNGSSVALFAKWKDQYKNFKVVHLETSMFSSQLLSGSHTAFRLNLGEGMQWTLELQPSHLLASSYELVALTPQGEKKTTSQSNFLYKGKVNGEGSVRLAIKEGFIWGSIHVGDQEYFIEPIDRFIGSKEKDVFLIYQRREDAAGITISCGYGNEMATAAQIKDVPVTSEMSVLGEGDCLKLKFVPTVDYSMYQRFGGDINAVESVILAAMNLAEGAFGSLNLGTDGSTDIGEDAIQFEIKKIVVSTCELCDIIPKTENASTVSISLSTWVNENEADPNATIYQIWTTRDLFQSSTGGIVGTIFGNFYCATPSGEVLKYASDDPAFLRVLVAHETGHLLGCPHDNDVKSSIRSFIMYSSAGASHTRFSTLKDFGGGSYSSHLQMRDRLKKEAPCLQSCGPTACTEVTGVVVRYFETPDSVEISWHPMGSFETRWKIKGTASYDAGNIKTVNGNSIVLKGLLPCVAYSFEVAPICNNGTIGKVTSLLFSIAAVAIEAKPLNSRSDLHDLQIAIDCNNCSAEDYIITIDHKSVVASRGTSTNTLIVKDLFSDGAVHRVEVRKLAGEVCKAVTSYKAPYYRYNSTPLLGVDFNDYKISEGWNDALLAKAVPSATDAKWVAAEKNIYTLLTARGNFDTTCMLYFSRMETGSPLSGSLALTSPVVDLTRYKDVKLHFDYLFKGFALPAVPVYPSFQVEVFDGNSWIKVFERKAERRSSSADINGSNIWDSIPARPFIDLDPYRNTNFKVRFITDDGSLASNRSWLIFAALDNIRVDGYQQATSSNQGNFILFPNPGSASLYLHVEGTSTNAFSFKIFDMSGRQVRKGSIFNYRIPIDALPAAVYLIQVYTGKQLLGTQKFIKF